MKYELAYTLLRKYDDDLMRELIGEWAHTDEQNMLLKLRLEVAQKDIDILNAENRLLKQYKE